MIANRLPFLLMSAVVMSTVSFQPAQTATTTLRVRGTIETYEPSTRTLSVSTSNGTVRFVLSTVVRIRQGWHAIDASALEKLSGYRVDVRYSESGGQKTVESVHVLGKPKG